MAAHIRMATARITVPAFLIYCQVLCHAWMRTPLTVGSRYGGSSMIKGVDSPFTRVDRSSFATNRAAIHPPATQKNITDAEFSKKAAAIRRMTGTLAPQLMNGAVNTVASFSLGLLSVRAAITPGTAHPPAIPPDTINGITEEP